jgi:tetratricopeptide (TPR) repeat protein
MGRKHHKISRQPLELSSEQLERQARDDLDAGRFRKARDAYKILCKQDRAKNLPGLIEANRRLAEQLTENGLLSEAEQVLAYLKTISPPSTLQGIDVVFALKKHDWQTAADGALRLWKEKGAALDGDDRQAAADALVLAFPDPEEAVKLTFSEASDLAAIVGALRCLSEERWSQAQELLRPVPRGSLFAAWKMLVKGMIAFYAGDSEKAETLFGQLPPHGVASRAADAFRLFLGSDYAQKLNESARLQAAKGACSLLKTTNFAPFLLRADHAWRAARHGDSYKEMRQAPSFPSELPDAAGALSDFYFKAPFAMQEEVQGKYLDWFERIANANRFKNDQEARLTFRMLGCTDPFFGELEHFWRSFLQFSAQDDPLRAKIAAMVLEHVGTSYSQFDGANPFFATEEDDSLEGAESAIRLFEESISSDPSNLSAYLKLLDVYQATKQENDRNRLLNRMAELFPKDKTVLLRAGRESLDRSSYSKAIEYLERAHSLDALDTEVLETLVSAYARLGRQHYENNRLNEGRHTFDLARRHAIRDKTDIIRGFDFLQALQAVFELASGDKRMGTKLMTEARECTRSLVTLLFFAHGMSRLYCKKQGSVFWAELLQKRSQIVSASVRKEIHQIFEYIRLLDQAGDWRAETAFVRKCLEPLCSKAFTREEADYFVPLLAKHPPFLSLAESIVKEALRRDPDDAQFRLFSLLGRVHSPMDVNIEELDEIYHDALKQGDTKAARTAQAAISLTEDYFESLEEEEEDDFGLPEHQLEEMRRMAEKMSDAEFEAFRQESRKFIPAPVFDLIMSGIREKPSRRSPSRKRRGAKQWDDQPDLF